MGPDLASILQGGPPPEAQGPPAGQPTAQLQAAIQALHESIAAEPDPEDKQALSQALQVCLKVQARNMMQQGGAGQALAGRLGT